MGDELEPLAVDDTTPARLSHRRILIIMAALIAVGTFAGAVFVSAGFGGGVIVGGVTAVLNYAWQRSSTRAIFERSAEGEVPTLLSVRYILRYVLIGGVVAFFYVTGALPVTAVILGLAAFTFAVVIEGLISIFSTKRQQEF
jgi:hypothetical protein